MALALFLSAASLDLSVVFIFLNFLYTSFVVLVVPDIAVPFIRSVIVCQTLSFNFFVISDENGASIVLLNST